MLPAAGIAFFYTIKFLLPGILAHSGLAPRLWPRVPDAMPALDYYQGQADDLAGTFSQVFSGFFFLWAIHKFFPRPSFKQFFWLAFSYILLTKGEVLLNPPYGDPISGPWTEAIWLFHHHFDYIALGRQPPYNVGGPLVYYVSFYPLYLALFMKFVPWVPLALFIHHLLAFLMASYIVAFVYQSASKIFTRSSAVLAALIVLALPLFQSQTEAIDMEIPSLFFLLLTVSALSRHKYPLACLYALLDIMAKGTGLIACGLVLASGLCDAFFNRTLPPKQKAVNVFWGLAAAGWMLLQVGVKFALKDSHVVNDIGFLRGLAAVRCSKSFALILGCFAVFAVCFMLDSFKKGPKAALADLWDRYREPVLYGLAVFNWLLLFINFSGHSPRYDIILCGLLVFCAALAAGRIVRRPAVLNGALVLAFTVCLADSYGALQGPLPESQVYQYLLIDRNLEYRNDLAMYRRVADYMQKHFADYTIAAPFIMAQTLAWPELGYVKHPLKAMVYGDPMQLENIGEFKGLEHLDPNKLVWAAFNGNPMPYLKEVAGSFPIDPGADLVLGRVGLGDRYAAVFLGGYAIDRYEKLMLYLVIKRQLRMGVRR